MGSPASIIIEQLRSFEEISHIYKTFGDHNILCEVYTRNVDELYEMIQTKMLKMPSVRNVEVDIPERIYWFEGLLTHKDGVFTKAKRD